MFFSFAFPFLAVSDADRSMILVQKYQLSQFRVVTSPVPVCHIPGTGMSRTRYQLSQFAVIKTPSFPGIPQMRERERQRERETERDR